MNRLTINENRRILVIDDNRAIHQDFRKILLRSEGNVHLEEAEAVLFGEPAGKKDVPGFEIDSAFQGQDGITLLVQARQAGRPYAMAFVDVRMPPGVDGVETTLKLWAIDPDLQVVICTAYSDYSWNEMMDKIGQTDRLVILKKPFDTVEVRQLAHTLTTKWQLLQENRRQFDNLEHLVAARTAELEYANAQLTAEIAERNRLQEQLIQSQKMEAIGRLAGGVAHDFNNILTAIAGFTELTLLRLKPTDPSWNNLTQVQKAAERATSLTRQLLAFGRKQMLQPRVFNPRQIITENQRMLRRLIGEEIQLATDLDQGLGNVKADPGQIEQVLTSFAINARDSMPAGGTFTLAAANFMADEEFVRQHSELLPGEYVLLTMSDTGPGLTDEEKARVFEPFCPGKDQGSSTGLGLACCFGIAKQSAGGHIAVESEPGRGTTFKLYLPRIVALEEPSFIPADVPELPRGAETILLVEDAPAVRMYATATLERQGYTVLTANDGVEGLRVAEQRNGEGVDLVVTDVVMPNMGGKALADQIHIKHPETKVLFTSGYTDSAIVDNGILDPGIAFLAKPYTPRALVQKVREMLDDCSQSHHATTAVGGLPHRRNA